MEVGGCDNGLLFSDERRFHVFTCDRSVRQNVTSFSRAVWVVGGGGGRCIDGRTDVHTFRRGTLTALRCRDKFLDPAVRPFAGARSRFHPNAG